MKIIILLFLLLSFSHSDAKSIEELKKYNLGVILSYDPPRETPTNIEIIHVKKDHLAIDSLRKMIFPEIPTDIKKHKRPYKFVVFHEDTEKGSRFIELRIINNEVGISVKGKKTKVSLQDLKKFFAIKEKKETGKDPLK